MDCFNEDELCLSMSLDSDQEMGVEEVLLGGLDSDFGYEISLQKLDDDDDEMDLYLLRSEEIRDSEELQRHPAGYQPPACVHELAEGKNLLPMVYDELPEDGHSEIDEDSQKEDSEDSNHLDSDSDSGMSVDSRDEPRATEHIEEMVLDFLTQLVFSGRTKAGDNSDEGSEPDSGRPGSKPTRVKPKIEIRLADRLKGTIDGRPAMKIIKYPRKCAKGSARPLAQLFRVLDLTHAALVEDTCPTKRDIYYQDVPLFKTQKVVDSLIDDLAATFRLERSDLNIRATSKGLICGSGLTIQLLSGEMIHANDTEGTLIPVGEDIQSFGIDEDISWVLIVEKDAVFQTLCRLNIVDHASMPGRGLIITGKGYPDIATRHLVKSLAEALPRSIPIMAFVDADPYGLDILSVYKYGSKAMQHESSKLTAKRVKWLGLWASEVESFGIDRNLLIPVTKHDEKKALSMLRQSSITLPSKWKKELMHMLHSRRKAEIEILYTMKATSLTDDTHCLFPRKRFDRMHSNSPKTVHDGFSSPHSLYLSSQASTSSSSSTALCSSPPTTPSTSPPPEFTTDRVAPPAPLLRYLSTKINDFVSSAQARANAVPY